MSRTEKYALAPHREHISITLLVSLKLASCGGGGDGRQDVQVAEVPIAQQAALTGLGSLEVEPCCGGGDVRQEVQVAEVPIAQQAALTGDWPLQGKTSAFIVRDDQSWKQVWDARKADIDCSLPNAKPYNVAACNSDTPPAIDFTQYALVGVLLDPLYYFVPPSPSDIFIDESANALVLSYQYRQVIRVPFFLVTGTRFILVPKTSPRLSARPSEA
jgi:hypothetical protein